MRLRGVLFFPVSPFDRAGRLDPDVLAAHIAGGLAHGPGGVFVACGTGEFTSLSAEEHAQAVRTAVKTVAGRVPVVAGAGGPLGAALAQAREAAAAGADGLLLFPPYLAKGPDLLGYVRSVCAAGLPVIVYQRDPLVLDPASAVELARLPGVVGLKDGLGDIDRIQRIVLAVRRATDGIVPESGTGQNVPESGTGQNVPESGTGQNVPESGTDDAFTFFNGLPTAELTMPAYRGIGVELYSSAAFAFAAEVATAFNAALSDGERAVTGRLLEEFYAPLVELRSRVPGYAVSLVKAAVRLRGLDVGEVRPPLAEPAPEHLAALEEILDTGLAAVGAKR